MFHIWLLVFYGNLFWYIVDMSDISYYFICISWDTSLLIDAFLGEWIHQWDIHTNSVWTYRGIAQKQSLPGIYGWPYGWLLWTLFWFLGPCHHIFNQGPHTASAMPLMNPVEELSEFDPQCLTLDFVQQTFDAQKRSFQHTFKSCVFLSCDMVQQDVVDMKPDPKQQMIWSSYC